MKTRKRRIAVWLGLLGGSVVTMITVAITYTWLVQSGRTTRFNQEFLYRTHGTERSTDEHFRFHQVTSNLNYPWGIAILPDQQRALITEKISATITEVDLTTGTKTAVARIGAVSPVAVGSHCGLLDITLHPDFTQNRYIYLGYSVGDAASGTIRPQIARARYENQTVRDLTPLLTVEETEGSHNAGTCGVRFAWHPDGTLLASIGHDNRGVSQSTSSLRGKIVRINPDGSIPNDNPFAADPAARSEIFSLGHRDPQGLVVASQPPHTIWAVEHGPFGGDELNRIIPAGNYGWPLVSYGVEYADRSQLAKALSYIGLAQSLSKRKRVSIGGTDTHAERGFIDPVLHWGENGTRSIAPSGMLLYTGTQFPAWQGDLFVAVLYARQIRRIELDGTRVVRQEILLHNRIGRIRQLAELADGSILVLTDANDGRLFRITK